MTTSVENPSKMNAVIMGRKTYDSIPVKFKPLPKRYNIILSSTLKWEDVPNGIQVSTSLEEALSTLEKSSKLFKQIETVWIIGGSQLYEEALNSEKLNRIYLTEILSTFEGCTSFFPIIPNNLFVELHNQPNVPKGIFSENGIRFRFRVLQRIQPIQIQLPTPTSVKSRYW